MSLGETFAPKELRAKGSLLTLPPEAERASPSSVKRALVVCRQHRG